MKIQLFCEDIALIVKDDEVATLEILNEDCFRRIVRELKGASLTDIRELTVLDGSGELLNSDEMLVILDPFEIDVNDKTYLPQLYKMIEKDFVRSEDNIFALSELSSYIKSHFNNLIFGYAVDLTAKENLGVKDFLKFLEIKVDTADNSVAEKLTEFFKVNSLVKFAQSIVFVNLKSMLSPSEVSSVLAMAAHTRCNLILLENKHDANNYPNERKLILDEDMFGMLK